MKQVLVNNNNVFPIKYSSLLSSYSLGTATHNRASESFINARHELK